MILLDSIPFEPGTAKSVDFRGRDVVAFNGYLNVQVGDCATFENSLKDVLDAGSCLVTVDRIPAARHFSEEFDRVLEVHLGR
ncbi:hypothetical protein [Natrinema caseinilyticum]|uniref:hypothetical protein n=1 Tax=Natrinema caseinilyticum TaxID=2961570 RepID=UPI0020C38758|nr:hypothetical protein [Natrinema caseinilyticum]